MPVIDIEFVCDATTQLPRADILANALGLALGTQRGRTWVRLRRLDAGCYAENDSTVPPDALPVFATVLHARPPSGKALEAEVQLLTKTIADCTGQPFDRVHVQYAPAAAGRQAFGGRLVGESPRE